MPESNPASASTNETHRILTFKRVFYIGIIFKGLDGLAELLTGIALLFISPDQIREFVALGTRGELSEDPHDFAANLLVHGTAHISQGTTTFLMIYLFIHAAVKLVSVFGILARQRWAYPFALITLGALTLYQFYDIATKPSAGIIFLTVLDIIVLWLIFREYQRIRHGFDPKMVEAAKHTGKPL